MLVKSMCCAHWYSPIRPYQLLPVRANRGGDFYGTEEMKITITIEDTENGQINVTESRLPGDGEAEETLTSATALADAMFEVMDQLGEVEGVGL